MEGKTTKIRNFRDLLASQRAMDFIEEVYQVSRAFPKEELYGLTSQLRRSAVSVPSNIAEGQADVPTVSSGTAFPSHTARSARQRLRS